MELQGSVTIPATPNQVWHALNDSEVLRQCIPGCEEVQQISLEEMHARVLLRMGPVRARFAGKVKMTDIRPLQGYTLNFEGSGGSAGFARGSSVVTLSAVDGGTLLSYTAQASVAGKLGQIGGRLMDASAGQLAGKFFSNLNTYLSESAVAPASTTAIEAVSGAAAALPLAAKNASPPAQPSAWTEREFSRLLWFAAGVAATSLGVWMGAHWLR
jgi:carbon monoxide dehydrogenase subunit G